MKLRSKFKLQADVLAFHSVYTLFRKRIASVLQKTDFSIAPEENLVGSAILESPTESIRFEELQSFSSMLRHEA